MEDNKELLKKNLQEQDEFEKNQVIMTPGQLVAKRFFRNKLACVACFFYKESQTLKHKVLYCVVLRIKKQNIRKLLP